MNRYENIKITLDRKSIHKMNDSIFLKYRLKVKFINGWPIYFKTNIIFSFDNIIELFEIEEEFNGTFFNDSNKIEMDIRINKSSLIDAIERTLGDKWYLKFIDNWTDNLLDFVRTNDFKYYIHNNNKIVCNPFVDNTEGILEHLFGVDTEGILEHLFGVDTDEIVDKYNYLSRIEKIKKLKNKLILK